MTSIEVLEEIAENMWPNRPDFDDEALIETLQQSVAVSFHLLAPLYPDNRNEPIGIAIHSLGCALLRYQQHRPPLH